MKLLYQGASHGLAQSRQKTGLVLYATQLLKKAGQTNAGS
jgi:hypothetical protein